MRQEGNKSRDCLVEKSFLKLCLKDKIWKYRGEGNANLVIALPKERLILRLHKWDRGKEVSAQVEAEEHKRVQREVLFCRSVMVPLLGSAYIQPPRLGYLDSDELIKLDSALKPLRPVYRLHKCIKYGCVTIYPDYALLPSNFKTRNLNSACFYHKGMLPFKSIENQNYIIDLVTSDTNIKRTTNYKNVFASFTFLNNLQNDDDNENGNCDDFHSLDDDDIDNEDDIFIENYKNINKTIDIPSVFRNGTENNIANYCQLISSFRNCSQIQDRPTRRFSTGSDFNLVLPYQLQLNPSYHSLNSQLVSCSAPVYSQSIVDMSNSKVPVYCVEIKPKQGWIPLMDRFYPKCTFCLNQYLKLSKGSIEAISRYCPLDLFSGNEIRMRDALKNLLSTPQNNLKLFHNGVMIYSGDMKTDLYSILSEWFKSSSNISTKEDSLSVLIDKFCDLVLNALTTDLTDGEKFPQIEESLVMSNCSDQENNMISHDLLPSSPIVNFCGEFPDSSQSCDWTSQPLPYDCILDRIIKIQQLEQSGADAVYKKYKNIFPMESDYEYVAKLCCDHPPSSYSNGILKLELDAIQRYLLATTAKDCSILIAFQRFNKNCSSIFKKVHVMKDADGISYIWNIGISDLDPKPLSCIEKHRKRDADVISSYYEFLKNL